MKTVIVALFAAFTICTGSMSSAFAQIRSFEILYCWRGNTDCEKQFLVLSLDMSRNEVSGLKIQYIKDHKNLTLFDFTGSEFKKYFDVHKSQNGTFFIETRNAVKPVVEHFRHGWGDAAIQRAHDYDIIITLNLDGSGDLNVPDQTEQEMSISGDFFPN